MALTFKFNVILYGRKAAPCNRPLSFLLPGFPAPLFSMNYVLHAPDALSEPNCCCSRSIDIERSIRDCSQNAVKIEWMVYVVEFIQINILCIIKKITKLPVGSYRRP